LNSGLLAASQALDQTPKQDSASVDFALDHTVSFSVVAGITGMSHNAWLKFFYIKLYVVIVSILFYKFLSEEKLL
jgi:hypothetical protein